MSKTYWYCPYCGEEVDPQNVTNQEMHEDCGHPVTLVDDSLPTYNQLQAENARLREALKNIGGIEATWEPCPYDADRVAFMTAQALAEEALYPYGSYLEQLSLKEGNDEGY